MKIAVMKIAQIKNNMLRRLALCLVLPTLALVRVVPVWIFLLLIATPLGAVISAAKEFYATLAYIYHGASYETRLLVTGFKMMWEKSSGSDE